MMATTINCEEMKVLELKDVVSDLNGLCQMLMEDRFEQGEYGRVSARMHGFAPFDIYVGVDN